MKTGRTKAAKEIHMDEAGAWWGASSFPLHPLYPQDAQTGQLSTGTRALDAGGGAVRETDSAGPSTFRAARNPPPGGGRRGPAPPSHNHGVVRRK